MFSLELLILSVASVSGVVHASPPHDPSFDPHAHFHPQHSQIHPRSYVSPDQRSSSYDFVIAGGGAAGLVLAARLSNDESKSILVLEAGPSGEDRLARINPPQETYFNSLLNSEPYDWMYRTSPQANAGGRVMTQPRGKLLGGSAAINGMYMVRPSKEEVNAWRDLIAPADGTAADAWNWDSFFAALKDIETFTPPVADIQSLAGMKYQTSSHGTSGDLDVTYSGYMVPAYSAWLPTLAAAGVPVSEDAYGGSNLGGFFSTLAINPSNWTRSYAKNAFVDTLPPRSNLHVISNATVERIVFADNVQDGNRVASEVQFSTGRGTEVLSVQVGKEAILCGGAMGSAHVLQLSGVGPADVLEAAGIAVKAELPGVGQHFLDHLASGVSWETTADTQGSIRASASDLSRTPEFNSFVNSAVAYINGSLLFNGDESFATFTASVTDAAAASAASLVPSQYSPVVEGYKAIYNATVDKIFPTSGLIEVLLSVNSAGRIAVQTGLQQPLSQGRMYINSSSVYDNPVIDPGYFSHSADLTVLRQGLKLARLIGNTAPLSELLGTEAAPGADVQTDEQIEDWLRTNANTEYHPCGACAMLPKDQGGVVDASLKVYGTSNVRVVDSSVFPISFSAHLMAPTYALAEKAASIILAPAGSTSNNTSSTTGSGTAAPSPTGQTGGAVSTSWTWASVWVGVVVPALFALL